MPLKLRRRLDPGMVAILTELSRRRASREAPSNVATLARRIGVSRQTITQWPRVPPHRAIAIEGILGIPREVLRPDVFGDAFLGRERAAKTKISKISKIKMKSAAKILGKPHPKPHQKPRLHGTGR